MQDVRTKFDRMLLLLAEDNPADQNLMVRAIERSKVDCDIRTVTDGQQLLDYLNNLDDTRSTEKRPDIILLDLNMPIMDGREVMKILKSDSKYCDIPIIVFSTSKHPKDIKISYTLGCSSFITKPADFHEFINVVKALCFYWFNVVSLPCAQRN